jgi:hypothetical protein
MPLDARSHAPWPAPDVIVYSKPNIFDRSGRIAQYIATAGMRQVASYPAFVIYLR